MHQKKYYVGLLLLTGVFAFRIDVTSKEKTAVHSSTAAIADTTASSIYLSSCHTCHKDSAASLAPGLSVLAAMTPRAIYASLSNGKMRQQGAHLSDGERKAVAEWITKGKLKTTSFPKEAYTPFSLAVKATSFDHSGWGNDKEGTGYRTAQQAGISPGNVRSLKLKWAFAFPDATIVRSKPAVVGDWLVVGGQFGDVFALHKNTGKIGWHFTASAAIRGAISVVREGNSATVYFADYSTNVYAVNAHTGKLVWNKRAGFDPQSANTGSVAVYGGKVYVPISSSEVGAAASGKYTCCFSSGGVVALDAKTGDKVWEHRTVPKATESGKSKSGKPVYGPSGAPVWCSPTVDAKRGLLYIGTGQNYSFPATNTSDALQALDLKTGKLVWNFQATGGDAYNVACPYFDNCPDGKSPDFDFGMAPILVKQKDGKELLVAGQKSGLVHALEPGSGKPIWKTRVGKGGKLGGVHWGMATDGNLVYAANADNIIAVDISDPSIKASPGLYALDLQTGELQWKAPTPECARKGCLRANSAAPVVIPGIVFAGGTDGYIRAYATKNGEILWDFDTAIEYETANSIKGKGGAIDGPAPVVSDGMLFVNSGYGMFGQTAGNVLLAFAVDGK